MLSPATLPKALLIPVIRATIGIGGWEETDGPDLWESPVGERKSAIRRCGKGNVPRTLGGRAPRRPQFGRLDAPWTVPRPGGKRGGTQDMATAMYASSTPEGTEK